MNPTTGYLEVRDCGQIGAVRRHVEEMARHLGFETSAVEELGILTTELATNLVVHRTVDGQIIVQEIEEDKRPGIEVTAIDRGPGIVCVEEALCDGYSTGGSMGCGLGAVRRLADEFDIQSHAGDGKEGGASPGGHQIGTRVVARKWVSNHRESRFIRSVQSRSMRPQEPNGDGYFFREEGGRLFAAVIDGLGHGEQAHRASVKALEYIEMHFFRPFELLFEGMHHTLRETRGCAVTAVHIDPAEETLTHAGIGNVTARIHPLRDHSLIPTPGIVGSGVYHPPRVRKTSWSPGEILVLFSDGLLSKWDLHGIPDISERHPTVLSHFLLSRYGRGNDDATVVVIKGR